VSTGKEAAVAAAPTDGGGVTNKSTGPAFPPAHSDQSAQAAKAPARFEIPSTTIVTRIDLRPPAAPEETAERPQPVPAPEQASGVVPAAYCPKAGASPARQLASPVVPATFVQQPEPKPGEGRIGREGPVTLVLQPPPAPPAAPPQSTLGHAPDYSWLCGELQHFKGSWRLRYAGYDDTDQWGGSVTLAPESLPPNLAEGQHVRVRGRLVPGGRGGPTYEPDTVQVLNAADAGSN
jgi:hypothetical protein